MREHVNAQKLIGQSIRIPEQPIEHEDWNKVYNKLGWPEKSSDYTFDVSPDAMDADFSNSFKEAAHRAKLSGLQAKALADWYESSAKTNTATDHDARESKVAETSVLLQREWGQAYDMNMAFGKRAAQHYFGDEIGTQIMEIAKDNPVVLKGFVKMGDMLKEHKVISDKSPEFSGILTPDAAKAKINATMEQKDHPYWGSANSPAVQKARMDMEELFKLAYPER